MGVISYESYELACAFCDLWSPMARVILRTFKTSLMPINHEMHKQVHTISYTYIHGRRWKLIGHAEEKCK